MLVSTRRHQKYGNNHQRKENIERANRLKTLADTYKIPLVCTGELRKSKDRREGNKPPIIDDLMETGKFAYNANLVWLLYSNTQEELKQDEPLLTLEYVKNKLSDFRGNQTLMFKRATGTMEEFRLGLAVDNVENNQSRMFDFD